MVGLPHRVGGPSPKADEETEALGGPQTIGSVLFSTVLGSTSLLPACCSSNHSMGLGQPWSLLLPLVHISCLSASHLGWSWKVTLLLTDFLVIQGPILSQECSLGTGPVVTMATDSRAKPRGDKDEGTGRRWAPMMILLPANTGPHSHEPLMSQERHMALT